MSARCWDYASEVPNGIRFRQGGRTSDATFIRFAADCVVDDYPDNPAIYTTSEVDRYWRNEHGWVEVHDAA
ncbi:hypothetical protein [Nocardia sp. CC227C]|uniref:hypothetical protein n=1 Tax=Nocardia sp. CC227C TaxID=3044562 RepID=UPI00278C7E37|nr:hypothetical protein [Nocardia sp. CC227C]